MEIQEVIAANRTVIAQAQSLNIRAGETIFPALSRDEMLKRFTTGLRGARRVSEVQGFGALHLPSLDTDLIKTVMDENPDSIEVLGLEFTVEYREHYDPRIEIRFEGELASKWQDLPDTLTLPGGRDVSIKSVADGHVYWIEAANPVELKDKIRDALNQVQWDQWSDKPEMVTVDPEDDQSTILFITAVYGQCVVTGDDLVAYGTVESYQYWSSDPIEWRSVWYRTELEAREVFDRSVERLAETKSVIAEKRAEEARTQSEVEDAEEAERLELERVEQARLEAERQEREAEERSLVAVERGRERITKLNQRREALDWELLVVYAGGFEFEEEHVSFNDEKGLQAAETLVANEEKRLEELRNREVTPNELANLADFFNK